MSRVHSRRMLTEADERILQLVFRYHCMTAMQVTKLLYRRTSLHWVQTKLAALWEMGYLDRDRVPMRRTTGTTPLYYALTREGMKHLASLGIAIPARARPYRIHEWSYLHVSHLLAVNEVLIAAELLCRQQPQLKLARLLHDLDLRSQPIIVQDTDGRPHKLSIDGFLDFELHHLHRRSPLVLELDRGSEHQRDIRTKVRRLLRFADGPYQAAFGRQALTICFIATAETRLQVLRQWLAAELEELGAGADLAALFRLASFAIDWNVPEEARPSPAEIFFAPRWYDPQTAAPAPLIPAPT